MSPCPFFPYHSPKRFLNTTPYTLEPTLNPQWTLQPRRTSKQESDSRSPKTVCLRLRPGSLVPVFSTFAGLPRETSHVESPPRLCMACILRPRGSPNALSPLSESTHNTGQVFWFRALARFREWRAVYSLVHGVSPLRAVPDYAYSVR